MECLPAGRSAEFLRPASVLPRLELGMAPGARTGGPFHKVRGLFDLANLEAGVQLIGPECAIPLQTPLENLLEISRTVRAWHRGGRTTH